MKIGIKCENKNCGKSENIELTKMMHENVTLKAIYIKKHKEWHKNNKVRIKCKYCGGDEMGFI